MRDMRVPETTRSAVQMLMHKAHPFLDPVYPHPALSIRVTLIRPARLCAVTDHPRCGSVHDHRTSAFQHSRQITQGGTRSGQIDDAKHKQETEAECLQPCPLTAVLHQEIRAGCAYAGRCWLLAPCPCIAEWRQAGGWVVVLVELHLLHALVFLS
jgi:hypothetical protein